MLCAAAVVGLAMACARVAGKVNPPRWWAAAHWALGMSALVVLAYASLAMGVPRLANWALVVLFASGAGGVVIHLCYDAKDAPVVLCTVHTFLGLTGFCMLSVAVFWPSVGMR